MLQSLAPHDIDAERTVIGALLIDADAILEVSAMLQPNDFYDPVYCDIYAAMLALTEEGSGIDFVTVAGKLKSNVRIRELGGPAFLAGITADVPTASHVKHYAAIVMEKSKRRKLADLGRRIAKLSAEEGSTAEQLTELAEQEFLGLSRQANTKDPSHLSALNSKRYDHYVRLFEADDPSAHYGIRTGFAALDQKLTGLAPGQLIILAGRPSMGKTALALDIAKHVAFKEKKPVCFISLEMSQEEVFDRMLGKSLGIPAWRLSKGDLTEEEFTQMGPELDRFWDYPFYMDDDACTDLTQIRSKARRQKLQHGLDLLIVDYLQLIEVTGRAPNENQTQRITYISRSLKQLARELECPVLALSQLSRACETRSDKRPQLSDLRDSGSIEQDGDRILMLYRNGEYFENCDDPDLTDVYIRKNRNGPTGVVELTFDRQTMTFRDHVRGAKHAPQSAPTLGA